MYDQFNEEIDIPNTDNDVLRICCGIEKTNFTRLKFPIEYEDSEEDEEDEDEEEDEDSEENEGLRSGESTGKRSIEEPPQELTIGLKKKAKIEENQTTGHPTNNIQILENYVILEKIMEYVPFPGKKQKPVFSQILRKVSRNIRQYMDRIKPDPQIKACCFQIMGCEMVFMAVATRGDDNYYNWPFLYDKEGDGCNVQWSRGGHQRKIDEHFRMRCLKDFEINMEHQLSFHLLRFEYLEGDTESSIFPFLEAFEEFFRTRNPLQVKELSMGLSPKATGVLKQDEVIKVLPLLDPNILETIDLYGDCHIEIDGISKLEQWMNAKELNINHCTILTPIQEMNITHFSKGNITVQTITLEDLRYLKEGFQNNSTLEKLKISFKECTFQEFRNDDIYQFMGIPHIQANPLLVNQRNIWFLRMSSCDHILHVVHFVGQYITFAAVEPSKVPESAWIHD